MTTERIDRRHPVHRRVAELRAALLAEIATRIDLDAGLRDALMPAKHAEFAAGIGARLDLEAGLAAILAGGIPGRAADQDGVRPALGHPERNPVAALDVLSAEARLRLRGAPALDALTAAFGYLANLAAARKIVDALDPDLSLVKDLACTEPVQIKDLLLDLVTVRVRVRDLVDGLAHDLDIVIDLDLADSLSRVRGSARHLVSTLDFPTTRPHDLVRGIDYALTVVRELALALDLALVTVYTSARVRILDVARDLDDDLAWAITCVVREVFSEKPGGIACQADVADTCLTDLRKIRDDFTNVDLRTVNLAGIRLGGIRWSRTTTRWPENHLALIELISEPIGQDLCVIRDDRLDVPEPVVK